jgi:hypothetical protein
MALATPRAKLFHAIVVVGLSTASAGCGASEIEASKDAGEDAPAQGTADVSVPDAPSGEGSVVVTGTDGAADVGIPVRASDAGGAAADCGPSANPGPDGGCWPLFV